MSIRILIRSRKKSDQLFRRGINYAWKYLSIRTMSADEKAPKYNDYFHEVGYYDKDNPVVTLLMGAPGTEMRTKSADVFLKASKHRLEREKENGYLFQYGPSMGDWEFRFQLSQFLTKNYKENVSMKNIMVTGGASQGLYMCASLFFKKGDTVFVEDPTYFIANSTLTNDLNLNVVPVRMDSSGIDIEVLEESIKKCNISNISHSRKYSAMVYLIPAFHNPLGICYSEERCSAITELARKHNLLIFCDDVYNLLNYSKVGHAVKPMFYFDNSSKIKEKSYVISNGTFSKLLGPGLRLGWLQAGEDILDDITTSGLIRSGGAVNNYTSGILASVIELGYLDEFLETLKKNYRARVTKVSQILREKLPENCTFKEPEGGFFVWIELPIGTNAEEVMKYSIKHYYVSALPGNRCSVVENFKNCIRIAFTYQEEQILFASVGRLCEAVKEYLRGPKTK